MRRGVAMPAAEPIISEMRHVVAPGRLRRGVHRASGVHDVSAGHGQHAGRLHNGTATSSSLPTDPMCNCMLQSDPTDADSTQVECDPSSPCNPVSTVDATPCGVADSRCFDRRRNYGAGNFYTDCKTTHPTYLRGNTTNDAARMCPRGTRWFAIRFAVSQIICYGNCELIVHSVSEGVQLYKMLGPERVGLSTLYGQTEPARAGDAEDHGDSDGRLDRAQPEHRRHAVEQHLPAAAARAALAPASIAAHPALASATVRAAALAPAEYAAVTTAANKAAALVASALAALSAAPSATSAAQSAARAAKPRAALQMPDGGPRRTEMHPTHGGLTPCRLKDGGLIVAGAEGSNVDTRGAHLPTATTPTTRDAHAQEDIVLARGIDAECGIQKLCRTVAAAAERAARAARVAIWHDHAELHLEREASSSSSA